MGFTCCGGLYASVALFIICVLILKLGCVEYVYTMDKHNTSGQSSMSCLMLPVFIC